MEKLTVLARSHKGPRERRRELHFQRAFCRSVLEAMGRAAVAGDQAARDFLTDCAVLEQLEGTATRPAGRIVAGMDPDAVEYHLEHVDVRRRTGRKRRGR